MYVATLPAPNATVTSVSSSASNVALLAANQGRRGAYIYNDSTAVLYVKLGATASTASFTVQMASETGWQVPDNYTGQIDGIWAAANGSAMVTEWT